MTDRHTERAFEDAIEHHLVVGGGWRKVAAQAFDRERALVPAELFAFLEATQGVLWTELRAQHGSLEPGTETEMSGEDAAKMQKLLDALEALDDVQDVYTTAALA